MIGRGRIQLFEIALIFPISPTDACSILFVPGTKLIPIFEPFESQRHGFVYLPVVGPYQEVHGAKEKGGAQDRREPEKQAKRVDFKPRRLKHHAEHSPDYNKKPDWNVYRYAKLLPLIKLILVKLFEGT
ncbi:MAG TPA: hypothetical protein VFW83_09990 [Bryobacteraceae bacterium]|nr:hypothetical protein [Bryobacteraceae bacterium]